MKRETMQNKLASLLGLEELKVETPKEKKQRKRNSLAEGIREDELQEFRAVQGITYFLQAPELFSAKICPHCKETFLVSRQFVAFCSYTCIRKDLESIGIGWSRGKDIERLISEQYDGNEPIWIKNLDRLRTVLETLPESQLLLAVRSQQDAS